MAELRAEGTGALFVVPVPAPPTGTAPRTMAPAAPLTAPADIEGTIYCGVTGVTAQITPAAGGRITVDVDIEIDSITTTAFLALRQAAMSILSVSAERKIASKAGIGSGPPQPLRHMADYAESLLGALILGGTPLPEGATPFDLTDGKPYRMLRTMRGLRVARHKLTGSLDVEAPPGQGAADQVYVPTATVVYDEGRAVPFIGHSDNLVVAGTGWWRSYGLPERFWSAVTEVAD